MTNRYPGRWHPKKPNEPKTIGKAGIFERLLMSLHDGPARLGCSNRKGRELLERKHHQFTAACEAGSIR